MVSCFYLTIFLGLHGVYGPSISNNTEMYVDMKLALRDLCPNVDICRTNNSASEPTALPTRDADGKSSIFCCKECSCQEDCQENLNCCFPDDTNDKFSTKECLYVQTQPPDPSIKNEVPAYQLVTSAPRDGCKPAMASNSEHNKLVHMSCSANPVAPWGSLFPVYSKERDEIYVNERCARCHGVVDAVSWYPLLVCNKKNSGDILSKLRGLQSLEQFTMLPGCYVSFYYRDNSVLAKKRCYINPISICPSDVSFEPILLPDSTNMTHREIANACYSGLNSPAFLRDGVYKNVFCALCNGKRSSETLACIDNVIPPSRTYLAHQLSFLIDPSFFQRGTSGTQRYTIPKVCFQYGDREVHGSCKRKFCPVGQIMDYTGQCVFIAVRWYEDLFSVALKLRYQASSPDILNMVQHGQVNTSDLVKAMYQYRYLPKHWKIVTIFHTSHGNGPQENQCMMIRVITDVNKPKLLFHDIRTMIDKPWRIVLNGTTFKFDKSFFEFRKFVKDGPVLRPRWTNYINESILPQAVEASCPLDWVDISEKQNHDITGKPAILPRLFVCDQVDLQEGEFTLLANDNILVSNLTKRLLFEAEFELHDDESGRYARVCLLDTLFTFNRGKNGSQGVRIEYFVRITWFIFFLKSLLILVF